MAKKEKEYEKTERVFTDDINALKGERLPTLLPNWLIKEGVQPNAEIINAERIGSKDSQNKTDIIVRLKDSNPIKLSVKMLNADYYGNWYGHKRIIELFGEKGFKKLTIASTEWANKIKDDPKWSEKPFIGVSLCFGKRSGRTKIEFKKLFPEDEILLLVRGEKSQAEDKTANALLIGNSDTTINNTQDLIDHVQEITIDNVLNEIGDFNIIFRPINPKTEGTNRGKNIYTKFVPYKPLDQPTVIKNMTELAPLGTFKTVEPQFGSPKLTHNYWLKQLEENYNIIIPPKPKGKK
ncbi:hypothetical protein BTI55_08235 [Lactobacillus delbrueckii subsp. bulgaricus]|nr:hypothetical protein [Lactobacillus delbrueckii subsp. bulgaricus]